MHYSITFSDSAIAEINDIYLYIAYSLYAPKTATEQVERILKRISALESFPHRHNTYNHKTWDGEDVRYFPVDNYLVFYVIDETRKLVQVLHIIYNRKDTRNLF